MKIKSIQRRCIFAGLAALVVTVPVEGADRFAVVAANGIKFSEFRGYDTWQPVAPSRTDDGVKAIVGNSVIINAYKAGLPGNGKPVPDGAMMAKIGEGKRLRLHGVSSEVKPSARMAPHKRKGCGAHLST